MKFRNQKCQIQHLGRYKSMPWVRLGANHIESSLAEMDKVGLVDTVLSTSQPFALSAKTNRTWNCIREGITSQLRELLHYL